MQHVPRSSACAPGEAFRWLTWIALESDAMQSVLASYWGNVHQFGDHILRPMHCFPQ
jgi:hypothetical protein